MVETEKPPWDPNDKEGSLDAYASWLNAIAREAFIEEGHHPEMFFFITEAGELKGMMFRDDLPREKKNGIILHQAAKTEAFGTIQIVITKIYHPMLGSLGFKEVGFVGASSPDSVEVERDCLIVRMVSKTGKDKSWANPILYDGDRIILGGTVETYLEDEATIERGRSRWDIR